MSEIQVSAAIPNGGTVAQALAAAKALRALAWDGTDGSQVQTSGNQAILVFDSASDPGGTITTQTLTDALAVQRNAESTKTTNQQLTYTQVSNYAASIVGRNLVTETWAAADLKRFLALLAYQAGAIDKDGVVQPLATWIRR